jgi:integrase
MTATSSRGASEVRGSRHVPALRVVGSTPVHPAWNDRRPALLRVCAGEPIALTSTDASLVELIDGAAETVGYLLDPLMDPDDYQLAEVIAECLCEHHGLDRNAGGKRVESVVSDAVRYLLPATVEHALAAPRERRGVASLLVHDLKPIVRMLAGELPLPAATVAGDILGLPGIACVWLELTEAARVVDGGRTALDVALVEGTLPVYADARTGRPVVSATDLRAVGLLREPSGPHGLARSTATNILRTLRRALDRSRDCGARLRGTLKLAAIDPLPANRQRPPIQEGEYVSLATVAAICRNLPVIGQVCLWIMRLTGLRIGEVFGLRVADFGRDELGRPFLSVTRQGGARSLERDRLTGRLRKVDEKSGTKTPAGTRKLHVVEPLARLIENLINAFHLDSATSKPIGDARLIPGIGKDDASGQATLRGWLAEASSEHGIRFNPHLMRAALVTDLKRHGVEKRLRFAYLGHEDPNADIQDQEYDLGVTFDEQAPVLKVIDSLCTEDISDGDLRIPTRVREQWGTATRVGQQAARIEEALLGQGWRHAVIDLHLGAELASRDVAERIGAKVGTARKLMRTGQIRAHTRPWGDRDVWVAWEKDVDAYTATRSESSLSTLAGELGLEYYQAWQLLRDLDLVPNGHIKGQALQLPAATRDAVRAEHERRTAAHENVVSISLAAQVLDLPVTAVETLLRRGLLDSAACPDGSRHRYVTRHSVDLCRIARPPFSALVAADEVLVPFMEAARLIGVSRPTLSQLGRTRQVRVTRKANSRHQYVTASSLETWAEATGLREIAKKVRERALQG